MAIGGILVPVVEARRIALGIGSWRIANGMPSELKWIRVSDGKHAQYEEFIRHRLQEIVRRRVAFGSLIIDIRDIDRRRNDGCDVLGQSKYIYQLLLHRLIPLMDEGDRLFIFPDDKNPKSGSTGYGELQAALNNGISRKYYRPRNVIAQVKPICSKSTNFGQVNDLLLGAVGFHANSKQLVTSTRTAKKKIAELIAQTMGLATLAEESKFTERRFQIWRLQFNQPNEKGATNPSRSAARS